jgi:hypothetical protein
MVDAQNNEVGAILASFTARFSNVDFQHYEIHNFEWVYFSVEY